jgi:hypothetical protein
MDIRKRGYMSLSIFELYTQIYHNKITMLNLQNEQNNNAQPAQNQEVQNQLRVSQDDILQIYHAIISSYKSVHINRHCRRGKLTTHFFNIILWSKRIDYPSI